MGLESQWGKIIVEGCNINIRQLGVATRHLAHLAGDKACAPAAETPVKP